MKPQLARIAIVLLTVGANVTFDQVTKQIAREKLMGHPPISYWNDFFRLLYVENRGAFLSLGADLSDQLRYWVLHIFPVVLLVGMLIYVMFNRQLDRLQVLSLAFIIGGGLSNVYDRLVYGQVTDFMNMGLFGIRTGVFNFADVSIMIGLGLMLPSAFRKPPAA
jgi:signal peptidase II